MATDKPADKPGKPSPKPAAREGSKAAGKAAHKSASKPAGKHHAAATPAAAPAASHASPARSYGDALASYPEWMRSYMPAVHRGFNYANRYLSVPMLRAGLGKVMSNPLTGYLMILRTRGRKSGEMRDAPLGYIVQGDAVYCVAGFGRDAHWFQNILADPRVEVILPGRSFSGLAQEVVDDAERLAVLPPLLRSMGVIAGSFGIGNVWKMEPAQIARKCEAWPLVRIRATGIAAGPEDPGGRYWIVPIVLSGLVLVWLLRRGGRKKGRG